MRVACALYGEGIDPNGFYAGTPGSRARDLLAIEKAARDLASDWKNNRVTHPGTLIAVVDAAMQNAAVATQGEERRGNGREGME